MQSDKEFYKLLSATPDMLFEFLGHKPASKYSMKSITLKEIETRVDGFLEPEDQKEPVYFVEFQAQLDDKIYPRFIVEMGLYHKENIKRDVRGILVFTEQKLDPKTKPWYGLSQIFDVLYLIDVLEEMEKKNPTHPLVLVFKPFTIKSDHEIEARSKEWYENLKQSSLPESLKETYCSIFEHWLMVRFRELTYEEVRIMLDLTTSLEETRAYKDIAAEVKIKSKLEEKIAIAKNMLKEGSDVKFISKVTGLSEKEIAELS